MIICYSNMIISNNLLQKEMLEQVPFDRYSIFLFIITRKITEVILDPMVNASQLISWCFQGIMLEFFWDLITFLGFSVKSCFIQYCTYFIRCLISYFSHLESMKVFYPVSTCINLLEKRLL